MDVFVSGKVPIILLLPLKGLLLIMGEVSSTLKE
jgi:hypothetical protein